MGKKIKVAIIGCGQISDAHLSEIRLIPYAHVVAVCDLYESLAEDTADRFDVGAYYSDISEMLEKEKPDVVHLATPPHTHLALGTLALERGSHVYVEKPFCTNTDDARKLLKRAEDLGLLVCPGFSQFYDIAYLRCKKFIEDGRLGDVVHVETYYADNLEGNFSKIFLRTKDHWIQKLPGKVIHNVITHALYNIIPYFPDDIERVTCIADDRSGNGVFQDELRVIAKSGNVTGYVTFTNAIRPMTQFVRIYGTKAIVEIDLTNHVFTVKSASELPGPLARSRNALVPAMALIANGFKNIINVFTGKDRFFAGMGGLFDNFYTSVQRGSSVPPVPYEYVLRVTDLMDQIAECMKKEESNA